MTKPQTAAPNEAKAIAAPAAHSTKDSRATVTVACKLPFSGFELRLCEERVVDENTQTGVRKVKEWRPVGAVHVLRGTAYPRGTTPDGFPDKPQIVGGAALNHGIPRDFWEKWLHQNEKSHYVVNGFIFAHENVDHVVGRAKEQASLLTGLEPIDTRTVGSGDDKHIADRRVGRSTNASIDGVKTDEDSLKARRAA